MKRVLLLSLLRPAACGYDAFPVKSVNLGTADPVSFYKLHSMHQISLEDAHPVYGFEASDGGFIYCGKGVESESSTDSEGFAAKFNTHGQYVWGWRSNVIGMDAINACAQLPNGGDVLLVGYSKVSSVLKRSITKLSLSTGAEVWTATDFGDSTGAHGAWEGISLTTDGAFAVLGGYTNKPDTSEMSFRSYGNSGGLAIVSKIPVSSLTSSTAPTSASASWSYSGWSNRMSAKAVRPFTNGEIAVMLFTDGSNAEMTTLAKLSSSGTVVWGPTNMGLTHGEGTDIQVTSFAIFMTGHAECSTSASSGLCGKLTKVEASSGSVAWSQSYSSCGVPNACGYTVIKNECWGLALMNDGGAVLACGTGIEDCSGMTGQMLSDCQASSPLLADTRADAVARPASVWQSLVIRTDSSGALLWQRVDQFRDDNSPPLGQAGWEASSSASEYVANTADGGLIFVNDEALGVGVMKLGGTALPPTPPSPPPTEGNDDNDADEAGAGLSGGAVAGIVGGVAGVGVIIGVSAYLSKGAAASAKATSTGVSSTSSPA
jgi:hypothetical protein